MTMVTLMLTTAVLWAGEVTVVKQLNGSTNSDAGEVTYSNGKITITPAEGNYITKDYITVVKYIDAGLAQTPRRAPGVSEPLTVTADNDSADPSGVTTYSITAPSSEYDLEITANFQTRTDISSGTLTLSPESFTYDGEAKEFTTLTLTIGGNTISSDNYAVEYSDNINAGTATVTLTGQKTYTGTKTGTFTIAAATATITAEDQTVFYTGVAQAYSAAATDKGELVVTYYNSTEERAKGSNGYQDAPVNAGTYYVQLTQGNSNYTSEPVNVTLTIEKAAIQPTVTLQGWSYGAEPNTPVVEGNPGKGEVSYTYKAAGAEVFTETVPTALGTHTVKATIAETANYQSGEATSEFTIVATVAVISGEDETVTYDGEAHAYSKGSVDMGTLVVTYYNSSEQRAQGSNGYQDAPVNAGTYYVQLTQGNSNYTSEPVNVTLTIEKATPQLQLNPTAMSLPVDESSSQSISVAVLLNGKELMNPDFTFEWKSSDESVVTVDKGSVTALAVGKATITVLGPVGDANLNAVSSDIEVTTYERYPLTVAGIDVTNENRLDILGDGKVRFDGKSMLVLDNAELKQGISSGLDELTIYLIGESSITSQGSTLVGRNNNGKLTFTTEGNTPGKLVMQAGTGTPVITGFATIDYEQNLTMLKGAPEASEAEVGTPVKPIVDQSGETNTVNLDGGSGSGSGSDDLSNIIINNVLYTLDSGNDDGIGQDQGQDNKFVVLGSTMVEDDVPDIIAKYTPGTDAFAQHFAGLTFMVPAGYGTVKVVVRTGEEGQVHVKIGQAKPYVIQGALDFTEYSFPYACTEATYVFVYSNSPRKDVEAQGDHRAGKKTTVTVGVGSVGVSSSQTQPSNGNNGDTSGSGTVILSDDDVTFDLEEGYLAATNPKVTTIADDAFINFPFLKFIDLSNTAITGIDVKRNQGPFNGVSKNTFIYLPAGNSSEEPNVIIGNVSQKVLLDGQMSYEDYESFGLSEPFMTQQAAVDLPLTEGQMVAVYLPFDISSDDAKAFGVFYTFDGLQDGIVKMTPVEGTVKAHVPYLFKSTTGAQITVNGALMSMPEDFAAVHAGRAPEADPDGLYGTYSFYVYDDFDAHVFRLVMTETGAVTFQRLKSDEYIRPFESYLYAYDKTEDSFAVEGEGLPTSVVRTLRTTGQQASDDWSAISGQRLKSKPTQKGIYIHNKQKVVVR